VVHIDPGPGNGFDAEIASGRVAVKQFRKIGRTHSSGTKAMHIMSYRLIGVFRDEGSINLVKTQKWSR